MAILIRDMEMPTACALCFSFRMRTYDGCRYYCALTRQNLENRTDRPDWCPLIPVPDRPSYDAQLLTDCGMEE